MSKTIIFITKNKETVGIDDTDNNQSELQHQMVM